MNHLHRKNHFTNIQITTFNCLMVILLFVITSVPALGQQATNDQVMARMANIHVIAHTSSDSVVLRWAPSTAGGWSIANNLGYWVERIEIAENVEINDANYIKLNALPLKPMSLEEWKAYAGPDNHLSAIAAQAIYGESFIPEPLNEYGVSALKNAADELSNRYSFSLFTADNDAVTATAMGLRYVDRDVQNGNRYAYRIFVAEQTTEYAFDTAYVLVQVKDMPQAPAPVDLSFESGDGRIKLSWNENTIQPYSGYYIYRSDDEGNTFTKMNKVPMVIVSGNNSNNVNPYYNDTLTINYKMYQYQVFGVTPFGELSLPAEITAYSKDLLPPPSPKINKPEQISSTQIKITWEMNNAPNDLEGFIVSRSPEPLDGFYFIHKEILSKETFEYIDDANGESLAYYNVAAIDTAGNLSFSPSVMATIIDTTPPSIPENLSGIIDTTGKVTLTWDLGKEKNIIGYRVLRANDPTHEFIQLTGHVFPDTVYIDTVNINTLTKNVYYKIAAVNNRYQHSALTKAYKVERPDIIAPTEAVFYDVFVSDSYVNLKWHSSHSKDLSHQLLFRKQETDSNWSLLDSLQPSISFYSDKDVLTNIKYLYTIINVDSSGLVSDEAFPISAKPYDTGKRKAVENLSVNYDLTSKTVVLNWEYQTEMTEKYWFVIYKSLGGGAYKEYKSVSENQLSFTDLYATKGQSGYGIVVMTSKGGQSEMVTSEINLEIE